MILDLPALRAAHAKTTQGEWSAIGRTTNNGYEHRAGLRANGADILHGNQLYDVSIGEAKANAHFIALAHAAVPELCDEVERLRGVLSRIMAEYKLHDAAAIDLIFQLAKDALSPDPKP